MHDRSVADHIDGYLLLASGAGKNTNGADIVVDGGMIVGFTMQVWNWVFGSG
jgi:hypothetical protein